MRESHTKYAGFASFLLALFTIYYVNIVMFTHLHIIDGVAITHSHPFEDNGHSHTAADCVFISYLSSAYFLVEENSFFTQAITSLLYILQNPYEDFFVVNVHLENSTLRAPPSII